MPILAAAREPAPDDEGEATPSTARGLKALAADRRVAFPKSQALAHLPLIPPAPPEADDFRSASKRSNSKPLPSDAIEDSPSSVHSGRSRDQSKTLDWRRRTTSKGKVQVLAVPEVAVPLQDDDIPGLPGVRESHVREAFNQIDFDGNGFIGVSELRYLLTVLGEEPTDAELDEMLAMIGGEGDGQAALEDFRMLFAPKSSVLAEMQTMAPEPEEEEIKQEKEDEQEEIPRLEAPPQQLGLLVKGAASFMQARIQKEDAGKKKASRARPKAKAPGSNRARPILGPPRHVHQIVPGMPNMQIPGVATAGMGPGAFNVNAQPPPVPGHMSGMPPLPPGYLVGTEKMFQQQPGMSGPGIGPPGAAPGMPHIPPGQNPLPGQPGAKQPAVDPLMQPSTRNFTANPPPKHLTFLEYQEMKLEHEVAEKLRRQAESDSD